MRYILVVLAFFFMFFSCRKNCVQDIPGCIKEKIESIKQQPVWNPPAEVHEYFYNGKRMFLISANCCDQFSQLYDEHCNLVCAPSGGIGGHGDGQCPDFYELATYTRLIWKDSR